MLPALLPDARERLDGPPLIALWGGEEPTDEYRLGTRTYPEHRHRRGQVLCVERGLIHVQTRQGSWLLPPHRAGWIPAETEHAVRVTGALSGWTVLIASEMSRQLPATPCVIAINALMRALVRRAVSWKDADALEPEQERIVAVLLDEIRQAPHERLHLPMPADPRLRRIAAAILSSPGDPRTLDEWASWGAVSPRTLRRRMVAETGLSFGQWRRQSDLTYALERLTRGETVGAVADALGYATPSAFIAMFRSAFGASPTRYVQHGID
ncbi:helix-turn-helix transcriptional regulator [uncultured Methylobacterium sp.]|jgi:AraC-like DNA-binding protein|uniref:AraC family transcriptional regulator n=1 Tax=uncultured Methylobacterium sp. TaxID=157278 RepID=UPI00260CE56D|nr:helix-turn-helix transcriptional regulator [uncultured Methylobacterium sp.]